MLELKNINKDYQTKYLTVHAIKDLSIAFRKSEFVSILGPSGCGKTTLLNLIGGLDRYNSGDLIINGRSTKEYKNKDWDAYRNHTIGFVFQSYNLIMHLNVFENVEMSLKLSGMSKAARDAKVNAVLEQVGLADKVRALPNELSGGQMQRVAIARALVNNPDILLADEPTGALDSETSIQILDLLKEIASDRLVIMVTHNPDLAYNYSTRIVEMLDGVLVKDSNPYEAEKIEQQEGSVKKPSMSFLTALNLSFKNMLTKKARTILVSLAGSIGIIGIALILSMSHGFQTYIDNVQESALAEYPLTIRREAVDYSFLTDLIKDIGEGKTDNVEEIKVRNILVNFSEGMKQNQVINNLKGLKAYLDNHPEIPDLVSDIKYAYNSDFYVFPGGDDPDPYCINPLPPSLSMMRGFIAWEEMIDSVSVNESKYELLSGHWPKEANEVVVILNGKGEISDIALYMLGERKMDDLLASYVGSKDENDFAKTYDLNYFVGRELRLITDSDMYEVVKDTIIDENEQEVLVERIEQIANVNLKNPTQDDLKAVYQMIINKAQTLKISGVVKATSTQTMSSSAFIGGVGYNAKLNDLVVEHNINSAVVKAQLNNQDINLLTGDAIEGTTLYDKDTIYDNVLRKLGYADKDNPDTIMIYANSFENKDRIIAILDEYNERFSDDEKIKYTDDLELLMSSVSTVINAVSYVLIAFVSVSLIVSSIMIGVITYISVLERTKEIGVLRSIGASKKDISRVFNAETLIIGFVSGCLGIGISLLLLIPINLIIKNLTDIARMGRLPLVGAIALIIISTLLTLIAGIIPSRFAAKRDPVKALRSE